MLEYVGKNTVINYTVALPIPLVLTIPYTLMAFALQLCLGVWSSCGGRIFSQQAGALSDSPALMMGRN